MNFALTSPQQELVDKAARLARESLAPRAAVYDEARAHPVESWRDLWQQGFLGIAIPAAHGGMGLDMPIYVTSSSSATSPR